MRSSQAAVDLIVAEEVSSRDVYEARYQHPEWPQGASGVTVGIGYDLGYATAERILSDWKDFLPPDVIKAMQEVAGLTGQAAHNAIASVKSRIIVPWDAAMAVFKRVDMPRWEELVMKCIPGSDKLPAGCFGVLTSIAYNRGASFSKPGDRYAEMRSIRTHVMSGEWDKVSSDIRSMERLWPGVAGLRNRREHEASLWDRALAAYVPAPGDDHVRVDTGDDKDTPVTHEGNDGKPSRGRYDPHVEHVQQVLTDMHYFEVGTIDGVAGGKLSGAIAAFMNDRGRKPLGEDTPEFEAQLIAAQNENWTRPISQARSTATAKDLPDIKSIAHAGWQKIWATLVGLPALLTAGFKSVFGDQNDVPSAVAAVKNFFGAVPPEYYWLAVGSVAIAVFIQAARAQRATVSAYQQGKIN